MTQLKLLSAALLTAALVASPAMARRHHITSQSSSGEVYADPAPVETAGVPYGYGYHGYRCVPAPRIGQFAGDPWGGNNIPCEPGTGTY